MGKISDVVSIYSGMSNTVNLKSEFLDLTRNKNRMSGYKPIKSHREIFLKIAGSMLPIENKVHLLVGHYGTGKSHLLLMLANYFSQTLDQPELKTFFVNFDQADKTISKQVQSIRGESRYLVAIPDYDSKEDFSENLLTALEEAFQREGFNHEIDSIYKEAIRLLEAWEEESKNDVDPLYKFSAFSEILTRDYANYNSITLLKSGMNNYEKNALNVFQEIYKKLIGTNFRYNASNIVHILKDILNSEIFKKNFKGVVFLYDEFDYTLKNRRISIEVVQQFAELCKTSNQIIFIGSLHKELSAFSNEYSAADFRTVQERFKTISMRTEGLEEIVTAIVHVEKENDIFKKEVQPSLQQVYQQIGDLKRLGLFAWLTPMEIQTKIIDAVYPLHPLTMGCLLKLSTTIGSSNRTLFTFLGGEGADENNNYSYRSFINNTNLKNDHGVLNFYTTDLLIDYFQRELDINSADLRETIKKIVIAYHSSVKEFKNNQSENDLFPESETLFNRIIKLMLLFEIIGISNSEVNLLFGLNMQTMQRKNLQNALKLLVQQKIIFFNPTSKVYEFRRGTDMDWDSYIKVEKERLIENNDYNMTNDFLDVFKVSGSDIFLDAKKYNSVVNSDKRLLRRFELMKNFGKDFEEKGDYFVYLENNLLQEKNWKDSYDGVIIYIIAETEEEVKQSREIVKNNNSNYIIVVIPENPIPISEAYLNLKAALLIKQSQDYADAPIADQARLDESYIGDINKGYVKIYNDERTKYLSGRSATWFGESGQILETKPSSEQEPVNKFLKNLYKKFNNINDEEVNKTHKSISPNKKMILKDAIDRLLESGQILEIQTNFGHDKGFIRYLKNVFYNKRMLRKVKEEGVKLYCEIEKDLTKYENVFPALVDMINEINNSDKIQIINLLNKYLTAPYGLGEVALKLFFAFIIKYFGDELAFKKNPLEPGEVSIQSAQQVEDVINRKYVDSIFEKRTLDDQQKALIIEMYKKFSTEQIPVGYKPRLSEVVEKLNIWLENRTLLAKSEDFYDKKETKDFLQLLKSSQHMDNYSFMFTKLQTVSGFDQDTLLTKEIQEKIISKVLDIKKEIETKTDEIKNRVFEGFCEIFFTATKTSTDLIVAINIWYKSLDTNQTDLTASWHNNTSKQLIVNLKNTQDIDSTIYDKIPNSPDYGLGKIDFWNVNNLNVYLDKIRDGKKLIEENKILVDLPIIKVTNGEKKESAYGENVQIKYDNIEVIEISIVLPKNATEVWISHNNEDPKSASAQKLIIKKERIHKPSKLDETLNLVSTNGSGQFSKTMSVNIVDKSIGMVRERTFGFDVEKPKNFKETKSVLKNLIHKFITDKAINAKEALIALKEILRELDQ